MQQLAKHIDQAHQDVQQVNTSAKKISQRFGQIDKCEVNLEIEPERIMTINERKQNEKKQEEEKVILSLES